MAPSSVRARAAAGTLGFAEGDELAVADGLTEPEPEVDAEGDAAVVDAVGVGEVLGPPSSPQPDRANTATQSTAAARPQDLVTVDSPPVVCQGLDTSVGKPARSAT